MKTQVLVLCTANSARSQMAEGLLRELAGKHIDVYSAGAKPSVVNPFAIRAMTERGIDISDHRSKHLNEFLSQSFDYLLTVCDNAAETCPIFPGKAVRVHWSFPDPAVVNGNDDEILSSFRQVRNDLEKTLRHWVESTITGAKS